MSWTLFPISALLPQVAVGGSGGSERPRDRQMKEALLHTLYRGPMGKMINCPLITNFIYFYQVFPQSYYLQIELHPNGGTPAGV